MCRAASFVARAWVYRAMPALASCCNAFRNTWGDTSYIATKTQISAAPRPSPLAKTMADVTAWASAVAAMACAMPRI